ncbi:MAG: NAD(P)-dependent oxidoreductase [Nitrososphaeria archaeon]
MKIGFAGLGLMGSRIAKRLPGPGDELILWDRTHSKALDLASGIPGSSATSDLRGMEPADVVFVMVRDSPATLSVVSAIPKTGKTIVNLATILPSDSLQILSAVESGGGRFVDAPVVGSTPAAEEGKLLVLASGDENVIRELEPLLSRIGASIYMGPVPSGAYAKLTANLILSEVTEALAEALEFAGRAGLDMGKVAAVINASPYRNAYFDLKLDRMLRGEFSPQFPLDLMHKDLKYVIRSAQDLGASIPLAALAEQVFGDAERAGCARDDLSAVYRFLESCCGRAPPRVNE